MSLPCDFSKPKKSLEKKLQDPHVISWRLLMKACFSIYKSLEQALLKENCSIPRFQILFYLYFEGPHSAIDLSRKLFVTRGNISTFVKRLLSEQIIEISSLSKSEKRPLYCLTKKGKQNFESIFPSHIERVICLMPKLPANFLAILNKIAPKN